METWSHWHDGQGGVHWLSGTHPEINWVDTGLPESSKFYKKLSMTDQNAFTELIKPRQIANLNTSNIMRVAAENLRKTIWFGVLEEPSRSYQMLSNILGLDEFIELGTHNVGGSRTKYKRPTEMISEEDRALIERLIPMDIWLYNYGLQLFQARWRWFKTGNYIEPVIPSFPDVDCVSTRYALRCDAEPEVYFAREDKIKNSTISSLVLT